jgi:hypothetical protein
VCQALTWHWFVAIGFFFNKGSVFLELHPVRKGGHQQIRKLTYHRGTRARKKSKQESKDKNCPYEADVAILLGMSE